MFIKRRIHSLNQIDKIATIGLISGIAAACIGTIWAIYLESLLHNPSYVGYLITFFTIVTFISYIFTIPLIERNSKTKIYTLSLTLYFLALILFAVIPNIYAVIILGIITSILLSLKVTSFGIVVSDKSKQKELPRNEGVIYTFSNIAWVVGPLIAGFVASRFGLRSVFALSALFMLISIILFKSFEIKDSRTEKKADKNLIKILVDYFKDKNRAIVYWISGGINFWWILIYIYMPILIVDSGYNSRTVGYFLFATVLPLISFTYFFGKLAGKIGFKKIFFTGYFILGTSALISFFADDLITQMIILTIASVGVSMLECTSEAYFFEVVSKSQKDKYYGPYNTTIEVNSATAALLGAVILSLFAFKYLFLLFAVVMFLIAFISLKTKNTIRIKKK